MAKAKKKTAKKVAKKATKKTTVKKKTVAKKAAKKTAKKTVKKTTARKKVAKKAVAKKTTSRKKVAKKAVAKKTAKKVAKKAVAKKAVAKKAVAKKVTAKKAVRSTAKTTAAKTMTAKKVAKKAAPVKTTPKSKTAAKVQAKKKQASVETSNKPKVEEKILDEIVAEPEVVQVKTKAKPVSAEITELEHKINDEVESLGESFSWEEVADAIGTLDFFVDHRSDECLEKGCDNLRTTQQYCRLHYFANWYEIKKKREILKEGRLQEYIEELISKYPPTLIDSIVQDLADEKDFYRALHELNISSEFELDDESFEGADDDDTDDIAVETRNFSGHRFEDDQ